LPVLIGFCNAKDGAAGVALDIEYNPIALDMMTASGFATALNEVRRLKEGGVCVVALCCRSFSAMYLSYKMDRLFLFHCHDASELTGTIS
jgi:hypothetical protein